MARAAAVETLASLVELGKPRITSLVLVTAAVGIWLAPSRPALPALVGFLAATTLLVASANTLNCWIERRIDARMRRTRGRPLPSGRLSPTAALLAGVGEAVVGVALCAWATNPLTTALGALALLTYVTVYTPLKRVSWLALPVGAIPGALPPLMGWTAATGTLAAPGWFLFAILFFWQLPHFVAIALYLKEDYGRGGLRVLPLVHGDGAARRHLFAYTLLLVAVSLAATPLGLAGPLYSGTAIVLGAAFVVFAAAGLARGGSNVWARRAFLYSLAYLPVLIAVLVLDAR